MGCTECPLVEEYISIHKCSSSTKDDHWAHLTDKRAEREVCNENDVRDAQQKQAYQQQLISENLVKALTEGSSEEHFRAGLTVLNCYTAKKVLLNADKAIRNLVHMCDGYIYIYIYASTRI